MNGRRRCQGLHRSPTNYIVDIKVAESSGPYSYQDSNAAVSIERTAASAVLAVLTGASSLLILPIDSTVVVILIGDVLIGDDSVDLCVKNNNDSSSFYYSSSKNTPRNHTCNRKYELESENNKIKTKERPPW